MQRFIIIFLFIVCILGAGFMYPEKRIETAHPAGDGKIVIYNYHLDELAEVTYRNGDRYDSNGLEKIKRIFRSRLDGKEHPIDVKLIELLDHLGDYFNADSIELISGFRSPELNRKLKEGGKNVATESMHLKGRAADIHIDEVTEKMIADYVRSLKFGGIGYYPGYAFVHIDTGNIKDWDVPDKKERLLIGCSKDEKCRIITDKNVYFPGEIINFEIQNENQKEKLGLEIFRRGKWKEVGNIKGSNKFWKPSNTDQFGKYRINSSFSKSNEFYIKSQ